MRKAVITGAGTPLKVVDADYPDVPPEGAVIRTLFAGLCHSDIHFIEDEIDLGNGKVLRNRDIMGDKFLGITPGHEICGVIEKIGEEADAEKERLTVGDRVCVYPWIGCQKCSQCQVGCGNYCLTPGSGGKDIGLGPERPGGFSTHVAVPKIGFLVKVPENVSAQTACMLPCSASTAFASLKKGSSYIDTAVKNRGNASVLIIGAGGLGLWCTTLAKKALFPENVKIVVADISEDKIKTAKEAGADDVIIWSKSMTEQEMVMMVTNKGKAPFDVVINFVGSPASGQVGLMSLMPGGVQIVIGLFGGQIGVSTPFLVLKNLSLIGSKTSTLGELKEVVNVVSDKGLEYPNVKYFSLDDLNQGLEELKTGKIEGRALIKFDQ